MPKRTTSAYREIIEDYKVRILQAREIDEPPEKEIINFRRDISEENKRTVYKVPLEYLRYRLNNSRLNAEVLTYQKSNEVLSETNDNHQKMVGEWLAKSDPDNMDRLINDMRLNGQTDVAICTCDGFLINGNRRRKALDKLFAETHQQKYNIMRVVVLPSGIEEDYGPGENPKKIEIQQIEYACQVQASGRSKYSGINTALLYKKNIDMDYSLEAQLRNDPQYHHLSERAFNKKVNDITNEHLLPLQEVDVYLAYFKRDEQYTSVSQGGDKGEGRWQAFIDWSNFNRIHLQDNNKLMQLGLTKKDIVNIRKIAFKIIRQRELGQAGKVHMFIRSLKNILPITYIKRELLKLDDNLVPPNLPVEEQIDSDGNPLNIEELDKRWRGKYGEQIINIAKKCKSALDHDDETNKPVTLLEAALAKLKHEKMHTEVLIAENDRCMALCDLIEGEASKLHTGFDSNRMKIQRLLKKKN
jgi:hypothetical protein|tara:strand:- start:1392 stop:2804 length:1413 start_codon:yes stop_codon:yes gene_type:complete